MNDSSDRYTEPEYQAYAREQQARLERVQDKLELIGGAIIWIVASVVVSVCLVSGFSGRAIVVGFLISMVVTWIIQTPIGWLRKSRDCQVADAIVAQRSKLERGVEEVNEKLQTIRNRLGEIRATGHVVTTGGGSIVIVDSDVQNSFIGVNKADPVLGDALQTISGVVEQSGNKEAGAAWTRFLKEVSCERDKSVMTALWDRVVKLVPDVAGLAESASKIAGLLI